MTYFAERDRLPWPVFMSSFGIGTERGRDYFFPQKEHQGKRNVYAEGYLPVVQPEEWQESETNG